MRALPRLVFLVAIWVLAWGQNLVANILTGILLAIVVLAVFPPEITGPRLRVNPVALLRLVAYVSWDLIKSNLLVAREVLSRRSRIHTGVIVHELAHFFHRTHGRSFWARVSTVMPDWTERDEELRLLEPAMRW